MKKCTIVLALTMIYLAGFSQTKKEDWMVGGNISLNTTTGNSDFTFKPNAGYFFFDNFAAGAELHFSFLKAGDTRTNSWGIGPFARYYFNLKNPDFKPLAHASFDFINATTKTSGTKSTNTITSFYIAGGASYFINHNVAVEALAGYNRSKLENQGSEGGFKLQIGFQVYLLGNQVKQVMGK
ncbi:MAG: outer membrane beta-barrel protein [Chitinophagaceae bacterium]